MSRSTRITLICHGPTAALKSAGFPADEPLIEAETAAVGRIRTALPQAHSFLCAPELRARQTAEMLAEGFTVDAVFRDLDYGRWRGRGLAEIQESEPDSLMAWIGDAAAAPHGGESIAAAIIRIGDWLAGRMSAGGHTVAVTHPAIVRAAIVSILEAPHESFWKVDVRPFSIAEITGDGRRWALRSFGSPPD